MLNKKFNEYSLTARFFEKKQKFFQASQYWKLAYKHALREDNRNWCDARALLCEHFYLLSNKNALPVYLCN
ncbi:TPA: ANR family transcriptional regulator [Raoultella planticola]|nr:ANR family transcriptional regulator [Raoultella planticola]